MKENRLKQAVSRYVRWMLWMGTVSCVFSGCHSQPPSFTPLISIPSSPLKDQQGTGLCWSFATTSFFETEAIRLGKPGVRLSAVYYVPFAYRQKANVFLQQAGKSYFGSGDLTFTVLDGFRQLGALPEEVYPGRYEKKKRLNHDGMDAALKTLMQKAVAGKPDPDTVMQQVGRILDQTIPHPPDSFWFKDGYYTPREFAGKFVGINPDDYIELTSFSHHPYYQNIVLEVPANWNRNRYLNLPLDVFAEVIDTALHRGFSLCWDGDATEAGFDYKSGLMALDEKLEKGTITEAARQAAYEQQQTTEDHNMHLVGTASGPDGKLYYVMKNSEGKNRLGGFVYMTRNALLFKTISVLVHKNALPQSVIGKLAGLRQPGIFTNSR